MPVITIMPLSKAAAILFFIKYLSFKSSDADFYYYNDIVMVFTKKVNIIFKRPVTFLICTGYADKNKRKTAENKEIACKNTIFLQAVYYFNNKGGTYSGGLVVSPGTGSGSGSGSGVTVVS